ncbi:lipopolysaccharide biosynthesis protein [Intrasporangium calvum]|uniref:Lipopolysaccharide biosynthesis protein n=1 Tax=Intrasporangium calvum TaxID=53358 RepID=A0ABT5GHX2_9MICO|nr:lipopolysaccharide biosynthesis protein [Intrasporangium calvum]MDC5697698.1 lipopolysaccharide biosynthesis protein [Intrasporangium calvum]
MGTGGTGPGQDREPDAVPPLDRGELQARALSGVRWTAVHTVVSVGLGFGVNILLARILGVVDYGRVAYLTTVITIAGVIAELGLGMAVVQFGTKAHAVGQTEVVRSILSRSQGFRLLLIAPVVSLTVLLVVRVDPLLMALAIGFGIWLKAALSGTPAALTIENKTAQLAKNAMLVNLLTQVGVVIAALTSQDADTVWISRVTVGALGVVLALPYVSRSYRRAVLHPALPRGFPAGFWRYAVPAGVASILGNLIVSRTEVAFLTWSGDTASAGLFALAFGVAVHLFSPAQALVGPLIPAISGLREVDRAAVSRALRRTMRASATLTALLVAGGLAPLAILLEPIYGAQFAAAAPVLVALGLGAGVATAGAPLFAFIQARLAGGAVLKLNLLAVIVNLTLILTLLPLLGLWGAVIANLAGLLVRNLLLLVTEARDAQVPLSTALVDMAPLLVGSAACLLVYGITRTAPFGLVGSAAVAAIAGLLAYTIGLRLLHLGLAATDEAAIEAGVSAGLRPVASRMLRVLSHRRD